MPAQQTFYRSGSLSDSGRLQAGTSGREPFIQPAFANLGRDGSPAGRSRKPMFLVPATGRFGFA